MPNYFEAPPSWQSDAVPSPQGWRHPRTNELLVSIRLDMSKFETKKTAKQERKEAVVETKQAVEAVVEAVEATVVEAVEEVKETVVEVVQEVKETVADKVKNVFKKKK